MSAQYKRKRTPASKHEQTTPCKITPEIKTFAETLSANEPQFVPVKGEGLAGYCYPNVLRKVKEQGGEIVYGRMIWESKKLIEAEWHCVWRKNGQLLDVTRKPDGEKQILFVETNEPWDGETVHGNKRKLLTDDPMFALSISVLEAMERTARRDPKTGRIIMRLNNNKR